MIEQPQLHDQPAWSYRPIPETARPKYGFIGYTTKTAAAMANAVGVRLVIAETGDERGTRPCAEAVNCSI